MEIEQKDIPLIVVVGPYRYAVVQLIGTLASCQGTACLVMNNCETPQDVIDYSSDYPQRSLPDLIAIAAQSPAMVQAADSTFDTAGIDPRNIGIVTQQWINSYLDAREMPR
ncbi:hypothetical protein [Pseudogulbenkiania ferrooxidans]|uniref:Uncharacterized protein n=1 Tax=Pseudogulbenkiania ferrooxidans 2002 TaxID=279714 RepID=B9Z4X4_9NEIS|nr:hypothetical protein [Pseudogulbenkiania ferrooxidans]EEG08206.1 hypothetical protein FuraDRAFT_2409 [Pseudogulbenkiania ferrooxidans 2002]